MAKQQQQKTEDKNGCPISRKQFQEKARPLSIVIDGKQMVAAVKEFSTGSLGWFLNDKFTVEVDGVLCKVQPSISLVIVHSADAK